MAASPNTSTALIWLAAGIVAGPVGFLLHELGHYVVAKAEGLPHVVLHSTSVTFDGLNQFLTAIQEGHRADAATIVPPGKAAATDLGGPIVSLVLLIVAVPLTGRRPRAWPVAMGASFAWRFVAPALVTGVLLLRAMAHNRTPLAANVDEYNAALELGIPPLLLLLPETLPVLASLGALYWRVQKGGAAIFLVPLLIGLAISAGLYGNVLGPIMFP